MSRTTSTRAGLVLLLLGMASGGCDQGIAPPPPPPPCTWCGVDQPPFARTPLEVLILFERIHETPRLAAYENLLAANFRFDFSGLSDPELRDRYDGTWGKDEEITSTAHLFDGFVDATGVFRRPASSIEISFDGVVLVDDPAKPDSGDYYKYVIIPAVTARITLQDPGDSTGFAIAAPHDFWVVRGDAAVLGASQDASPERWYLVRWADKSAALTSAPTFQPDPDHTTSLVPTSWGAVKAAYAPPFTARSWSPL